MGKLMDEVINLAPGQTNLLGDSKVDVAKEKSTNNCRPDESTHPPIFDEYQSQSTS